MAKIKVTGNNSKTSKNVMNIKESYYIQNAKKYKKIAYWSVGINVVLFYLLILTTIK